MQRGHRSSGAFAGGPTGGVGWIPVALAAAFIVSGLVGRKKGAVTLALTVCAGIAVANAACGPSLHHGRADRNGSARNSDVEPEVERAITIGNTADELRKRWLAPQTIPRLMAGFATLHATGNGRMHWQIRTSLGRAYEWEAEIIEEPDGSVGWRSLPDAPVRNEGSVRFEPAPDDRGTVATLRIRFDPPGGMLGGGLLELFGRKPLNLIADGALRRFKSLVETGEIPTTKRQPAARKSTR
ncbi:SRPBCC family protein [Paraburkholderia strydomiana]|uniref:SRPBCC family protein n=1 Tax=Paraburkholderia strydomiana TaxID=1245417 RepID=UPI0038B90622